MGRAILGVAVAVLVVTAGCNAVLGGDRTPTTTPTATPRPTPTPQGSVGTPTPVGVSVDGVTEPLELARAHVDALGDVSYTMRYRRVLRADNGTRLGKLERTSRVDRGWRRYVSHEVRTGVYADENFVTELFAFATLNRTFLIWQFEGRRSYQRLYRTQAPIRAGELTSKTTLYLAFAGVDTRVVDVRRRNGSVVYAIESTAGPHEFGGPNVTNVSLSATVERSGRVLTLRLEYDRIGARDGRAATGHVVEVLRFGRFNGTTVVEPDWVDQVRANTSALPDRRSSGGGGGSD